MQTIAAIQLTWNNGTQWDSFPELGQIYSDSVKIHRLDEGYFRVSFYVGEGRRIGMLFVEVESHDCDGYSHTLHYCLGQFYKNEGAMKFAKFALEHFIETETWSVCPSFEAIEYIDGEPHTLGGDEIVSELYTW